MNTDLTHLAGNTKPQLESRGESRGWSGGGAFFEPGQVGVLGR